MKHKLLTLILALTVIVGLVSTTGITASAATGSYNLPTEVEVAGTTLADGESTPDGSASYAVVNGEPILTLNNYNLTSDAYHTVIYADGDLTIDLIGDSVIVNEHVNSAAAIQTIKVDGNLVIKGSGTLYVENTGYTSMKSAYNTAITAKSVDVSCAKLTAIAGSSQHNTKGPSYGIYVESSSLTIGMTTKLIAKGYNAAWADDSDSSETKVNYLPNSNIKFDDNTNPHNETHYVNTSVDYDEAVDVDTYDDLLVNEYKHIEIIPAVFVTIYNDGNKLNDVKWEYNTVMESPSHPTVDGHIFMGWYNNETNKIFDFSKPITSTVILNAKFAAYDNDIDLIWKDIDKLTKKLQGLTDENGNPQEVVDAIKELKTKVKKLEDAQLDSDDVKKLIDEANLASADAVKKLTERVEKIETNLSNLTGTVDKNAVRIDEAEKALSGLKEAVAKLDNTYATDAALEKAISDLKEAITTAEGNLKLAIEDLQKQINDLSDSLNKKTDDLNKLITDANGNITANAEAIAANVEELKAIREKATDLSKALEQTNLNLSNLEILVGEVDKATEANEKAIKALKDEIDSVRGELNTKTEALNKLITDANGNITANAEAIAANVEELKAMREKATDLSKALEQTNLNLSNLETLVGEVDKATEANEKAIKALKDEIDSVRGELNTKTEALNKLIADANGNITANAEAIAANVEELKAIREKATDLSKALEQTNLNLSNLETLVGEVDKATEANEKAIKALKDEIDSVRGELETAKSELQAAIDSKADAATVNQKLAELNVAIAKAQATATSDAIKVALANDKLVLDTIMAKINEVQAQLDPAVILENVKQELMKQLAAEMDVTVDEVTELLKETMDLLAKLKDQIANNEELKAKIENAVKQAKDDVVAFAEAKVEEIKAELQKEMREQADAIANEKIAELEARYITILNNYKTVIEQYADDKIAEVKADLAAKLKDAMTLFGLILDSRTDELKAMMEELELVGTEAGDLINKIVDQVNALNALQQKAKDLEKVVNEKIAQYDKLVSDFNTYKETLTTTLSTMSKSVATLTAKVAVLEKQVATALQTGTTNADNIATLTTNLANLTARVSVIENTYATDAELAAAISELQTTLDSADVKIREALDELTGRVDGIESKLNQAIKDKADASVVAKNTEDLANLTTEVKGLVEKLEKLDESYATDAELATLKSALEDADIKIREALDDLTGRVDGIESKLNQAIKDKADASVVAKNTEDLANLTTEVEGLIENLEKLDESYATDAELATLKSTLEGADVKIREALDDLTGRVDNIESKLNQAIKDKADASVVAKNTEDLANLTTEVKGLIENLEKLDESYATDAELATLKSTLEGADVKIREALDDLTGRVDGIESKLNQAIKDKADASDVKVLQEDLTTLTGTVNDLVTNLEKLDESYTTDKELAELKSTLEQADATLAASVNDLKDRVDNLENNQNSTIQNLAVALLAAGTILTFGAVYFIFGNRFFPVDPRRSYQHVYIKDGVSKIRHTKSKK